MEYLYTRTKEVHYYIFLAHHRGKYSHRQLTDHMPIHLPTYLYTLELRMFSNVHTNCYPSPLASRRFVHGRESATGTMNVKGISEHAAVKGEETTEWR